MGLLWGGFYVAQRLTGTCENSWTDCYPLLEKWPNLRSSQRHLQDFNCWKYLASGWWKRAGANRFYTIFCFHNHFTTSNLRFETGMFWETHVYRCCYLTCCCAFACWQKANGTVSLAVHKCFRREISALKRYGVLEMRRLITYSLARIQVVLQGSGVIQRLKPSASLVLFTQSLNLGTCASHNKRTTILLRNLLHLWQQSWEHKQ